MNQAFDKFRRGRLNWLVNRPYYVYRPAQVLRRARLALAPYPSSATVELPWGLDLTVDPREALGAIVLRNAVYEIAVSEAIYRLSDPGELAIDVGANIGYMTSILAARTGPSGTVIACEPHPALFDLLSRNVERWTASSSPLPPINTLQLALSDRSGKGQLSVPPEFAVNRGTAALADDQVEGAIEVSLA
ncbi:MAG: FkbM family methyltransferase, partial [Hyalangium sp.]|uniref:FkbM family methyltransferase n=1 Tax=Hyalangium sp. TaxID=2028555 RepID=UPI00389B0531